MFFAYIDAWRVEKLHDRRDGDFTNRESQQSGSDAEAALFLSKHFFTSENNANKAPYKVIGLAFSGMIQRKRTTPW